MSTFSRENDELRRELRLSVAGTLRWWPKLDGANVLLSTTGGEVSVIIKDPGGSTIQTISDATSGVTDIGSPAEYSYLDISASAISVLDEDYSAHITWRQRGASVDYLDVIWFDVVRWPWGQPSVSLNDMLEERPDAADILLRHGLRLGYSSATAAATMAGVYAVRARVELDAKIRDTIEADRVRASETSTGQGGGDRYTRPNLVLNRERLSRVERKLAMRLLFAADMGDPEGGDESAGLFRFYDAEAERAWRSVGPLKYDGPSEDIVATETITDIARSRTLRRAW